MVRNCAPLPKGKFHLAFHLALFCISIYKPHETGFYNLCYFIQKQVSFCAKTPKTCVVERFFDSGSTPVYSIAEYRINTEVAEIRLAFHLASFSNFFM